MSTAIHEESLAALIPGGSLDDIQLAEFPGLVLAVDVGDPEADPPVEPSVTAKDADGEEVTPPTWQAVLGALRYTPGTWLGKQPSVILPPRIDPAPRYAGDGNPPIEPGATLVKTGAQWIDDVTTEPLEPGTFDLRTEWRYADDTPAPGLHNDGEYLVDARDVGMTIKVVEMAVDTVSESSGIGPVQPGTSGSAPLVDANGNLLDQASQPPEAIMPPPSFISVQEPIAQIIDPPAVMEGIEAGREQIAEKDVMPVGAVETGVTGEGEAGAWPRTHAEMDEWAAENGVEEWSSANLTLAEKQSELEAAGVSPPPIETTE